MPSEPRKIESEITANKEGTQKIVNRLENIEGRLDGIEEKLKPQKLRVIGCVRDFFNTKCFVDFLIGVFISVGLIGLSIVGAIVITRILIDGGVEIDNIIQEINKISLTWQSVACVAVPTIILVLGLSLYRNRKKREEEEWQKKYFGEYNNVLKRMQLNLESMRKFYTWTQMQARMAFGLAVGMCIAGIVLICVAIKISNTDMTIVSAIGGVATELIAGTALIVYRRSLSQLNYYHKALHQDQRFLSSVDLLNDFEDEDNDLKNEMRKAIIQGVIDMNRAEFAHQDGEEEKEEKEKKTK